MFVCLSSGARPRYRQDILRAIAMPRGARLQFRYRLELVAESVQVRIRNGTANQEKVLIAYLDQSDRSKMPEFVPCRFATIVGARIHGSTTTAIFELDAFAYAHDVAGFNSHLRTISGERLPLRQNSNQEFAQGAFWFEVPGDAANDAIGTYDLTNWENIVTQLTHRQDFATEKCFYVVEGLRQLPKGEKVEMRDGMYPLKSSHKYEIGLYHFLPKEPGGVCHLNLAASPPSSIALPSGGALVIDSEYDMKCVLFETAPSPSDRDAILSVTERDQTEALVSDFDLPLHVSGSSRGLFGLGLAIGILIAVPHLATAITTLSGAKLTWVCLMQVVASILAGLLAAFGLNKRI